MPDQAAESWDSAPPEETDPRPLGRSLVMLSAPDREELAPPRVRHSATFLAQLIATAQQVAQTRARRQIEPGEAVTRYAAAGARPHLRGGRIIRSGL